MPSRWKTDRPMSLDIIEILKDWQTLLSGILALLGAILTVRMLYVQISKQERYYIEQRDARLSAAKALLPIVLSEIMEYAESLGQYLVAVAEKSDRNTFLFPDAIAEVPKFPRELILALVDGVEASNVPLRFSLLELCHFIQIGNARIEARISTKRHKEMIIIGDMILDAARLYAQCDKIFTHLRGDIKVSLKDIEEEEIKKVLLINFHYYENRWEEIIRIKLNKAVSGKTV